MVYRKFEVVADKIKHAFVITNTGTQYDCPFRFREISILRSNYFGYLLVMFVRIRVDERFLFKNSNKVAYTGVMEPIILLHFRKDIGVVPRLAFIQSCQKLLSKCFLFLFHSRYYDTFL